MYTKNKLLIFFYKKNIGYSALTCLELCDSEALQKPAVCIILHVFSPYAH